jgi:hypothetical protein
LPPPLSRGLAGLLFLTLWFEFRMGMGGDWLRFARNRMGKEKIYFTSLNYSKSLVFLSKLENRVNHLPQLLKPFVLPPWPYYRWFSKTVMSFSFLLILADFYKKS